MKVDPPQANVGRDRFGFGENWRSFLEQLDEERIDQAVDSMIGLLDLESAPQVFSLAGKRMLDLGSGSGLFSLAAHRLGAEVLSIDYDAQSVACTEHLQQSHANESKWEVRQGSALDDAMLSSLEPFDLVYSWGVLHHTGDMWKAIDNASGCVAPGGRLVLSIYNDQGAASRRWLAIKKLYNRLPPFCRPLWVAGVAGFYESIFALARLKNGRNPLPFADWRAKKKDRGMSAWHDWVDWVGGLPFEVATPERVIAFLESRGFAIERTQLVGKGWGCNEFVFTRMVDDSQANAFCD
ncbi:MAG: class I SAM-dependent methyltransferase [Planctomycetota bacterium]